MTTTLARAALVTGAAATAAIVADRVSKHVAEQALPLVSAAEAHAPGGPVLQRVENPHGTVGVTPGVLAAGAALAIGIGTAGVALRRPLLLSAGAGLIAGSMASNLYDRATRGAVTDFIRSPLGVLNCADLTLALGIAALGVGMAVR